MRVIIPCFATSNSAAMVVSFRGEIQPSTAGGAERMWYNRALSRRCAAGRLSAVADTLRVPWLKSSTKHFLMPLRHTECAYTIHERV